jgi:hypothetical protein
MVREITLLEVHLDGARFGTNETVASDDEQPTEQEGPSVAKLVLASLFLSIAVTVIVRRLFGDETDEQTETEDPIEVEIES